MTMISVIVILNVLFMCSVWAVSISTSLKMLLIVFLLVKMGLHFLSAVYLERGCNQVFWLNLNLIASAVLVIVTCIVKVQNSKFPIHFLIAMAVLVCVQDFMAVCHLRTGKKDGELS